MKKQIAFKFSLLLILFLVSSCLRDGENLDECIRRMRIELRWINTSPLDDNEQVSIVADPMFAGTQSSFISDIYGVDVDLLTGGYNIAGWESYSEVDLDITNHTVNVHTQADGTAVSPPLFSAGSTTATVELTGGTQIIPLPMYRQVRPLIIEINLIGDGYALVNGITGTLQGITLERSLENAFPPVSGLSRPTALKSGNIDYTFALSDGEGTGVWYAETRNLIGVDGASSQMLDLDVTFSGDNEPSSFQFDVTSQLAEFQTKDINEPWYIIITLNLGANLDITIVDWIAGSESWITAQ